MSSTVLSPTKEKSWIWNDMRVSKWGRNSFFCENSIKEVDLVDWLHTEWISQSIKLNCLHIIPSHFEWSESSFYIFLFFHIPFRLHTTPSSTTEALETWVCLYNTDTHTHTHTQTHTTHTHTTTTHTHTHTHNTLLSDGESWSTCLSPSIGIYRSNFA